MGKKNFFLKTRSLCVILVILSICACAQSGADEVITITLRATFETTTASENAKMDEEDVPDRDEVNLDGGGFQCDWHEAVELTEEDALPEEKLPVAYAEDENFWYDIYEDHVVIERYIGTDTAVKVPATYEGLPVTEIQGSGSPGSDNGFNGFYGTDVEEVVLPDGLLTIDEFAFAKCEKLTEIKIPDSVTRIGRNAFSDTPWYENLTDEFVIVGDGCLIKYNGSDTFVEIPDGVKGIFGAFLGNEDLVSVAIPDSVTVISAMAFAECVSLESIEIPKNVTEISEYSFDGCICLTSVAIPENVQILTDSFGECSRLTEVTGASGVISLSGFGNCASLQNFPFAEGLIEIGDNAFFQSGLTEVVFPQSLKYIGNYAFYGCQSLQSIKDGKNVVRVEYGAFEKTPWFESKTDYFVTVGKNVLINYNGKDAEVEIPDTVTYLGGAFVLYEDQTDDELEILVIPASVQGITTHAFFGRSNLTEIQIFGESVVFGESVCSYLAMESFSVPEGTAVISCNMFSGATLQKIEIPDTVIIIGCQAFWESSFQTLVIPESVLMIGDNAFAGNTDLIAITIPASVTRIGENVFEGCSEDLTIYGEAGSRAESYAAEYGINFEVIS